MEKIRTIAAILILACGTLGIVNPAWADNNRHVERERRLKLIKSAERWLNVRELTGNNDHPMIARSMELCGLPGNKGYPWCASSQSEIFYFAEIPAIRSARAKDWFKKNVIWKSSRGPIPRELLIPGMLVGYYYPRLGRIGHIGMLVGWDNNNLFVYEGNTSPRGLFNPENFLPVEKTSKKIVRGGDGFYPKTRRWEDIAIIADHVQ